MTKQALSQQLAEARRGISKGMDALAWETNLPQKLKRSVGGKPAVWMGTAAALGFVLALFSGRRRPRKVSGVTKEVAASSKAPWFIGVPFALLRLLFPLIQPLATEYVSKTLPLVLRELQKRSRSKA